MVGRMALSSVWDPRRRVDMSPMAMVFAAFCSGVLPGGSARAHGIVCVSSRHRDHSGPEGVSSRRGGLRAGIDGAERARIGEPPREGTGQLGAGLDEPRVQGWGPQEGVAQVAAGGVLSLPGRGAAKARLPGQAPGAGELTAQRQLSGALGGGVGHWCEYQCFTEAMGEKGAPGRGAIRQVTRVCLPPWS